MAQLKTDRSFTVRNADSEVVVQTWTHGKVHGLVADASQPTGFRLVGTAETQLELEAMLVRQFIETGSL
jgi:hypothetical protein